MRTNIETASHIIVAIGVVFAVFQYIDHIKEQKQISALEYVRQFNEPHFLAARRNVLEPWLAYDLDVLVSSGSSSSVFSALSERIVEQSGSDSEGRDIRIDMIEIATFANSVHVCVKERICDEAIVNRLLGVYFSDFYCLYETPLETLQRDFRLAGLNTGLSEITAASGGCRRIETSQ